MQAAIYARVSTERQERDQTIESQIATLNAWVRENGHELQPEHVFVDQGYSGSRLDRPALDRLRDEACEGAFDVVAVLSPDRLARKYAYQVLLLEEFQRVGCQVAFFHHPMSDDPNDQLLLQIRGAIAEYERALLGERFRRGKLQKARSGHYLAGKAPYGYRYIPRHEGTPGYLVVDEGEAEMVRTLYRWLTQERLTIRQMLKRLNFGPWFPRSGKHPWSPSVVHHILSDPLYSGTAYANRYRYVLPKKPRTPRGPRTAECSCRQPRPREEWIPIPVPAILDEETYGLAQAQLARNATLSFRNNTKYAYLLRCLLTCSTCGLAMFGRTYKATSTSPERTYYTCHGKDAILNAREQRCPRRSIRAEQLEAAVWNQICQLLTDPAQLLAQFQRFAEATSEGDEREGAEERNLDARLERLKREEGRLVDAYQAEIIDLPELAQRRQQLERRRQALVEQRQQRARLHQERARAQEVLASLTAFCERIRARIADATFEEKQAILQLLIERIIVREDSIEIRHVIPLGGSGSGPPNAQLRSDGVHPAALPACAHEHLADRLLETGVGVASDQPYPPHAPGD